MARFVLFLLYPALSHLSIYFSQPLLMAGAFSSLTASLLLYLPHHKRVYAWLLWFSISAVMVWISSTGDAVYLAYLPPVIIPFLLLIVFGKTLFPGATPLITVFAESVEKTLSDQKQRYTRNVTRVWTAWFAIMVIEAIVMPFYVSQATWSLFTNVINYMVCGVLFVGEYGYRRWRFVEQNIPGFFEHIRLVIAAQAHRYGQK